MIIFSRRAPILALAVCLAILPGCSLRKFAVNRLGDAIAAGGSTYESDEDLELIGAALPFSLKLLESLLAESPEHPGMLLASCKGFTSYAYAYVHLEADRLRDEDLERSLAMKLRAGKLYRRAFGYCVRGLEAAYPEFGARLEADPRAAVAQVKAEHVPFLYWSAASLGLGISASRDDASMLARLPEAESLLDRGMQLQEDWEAGAFHEFAILFAGARPSGGADAEALRPHYDRALQLSAGRRASLYLAWAEAVSVARQDAAEFRLMLQKALAVDPEEAPSIRLANHLAQDRARWLEQRIPDLFLDPDDQGAVQGDAR